ncbi:MAG: CvpA family protein [Clostridiales bacterium]|nr:CvpA family protein [Clostridiales bacterium]
MQFNLFAINGGAIADIIALAVFIVCAIVGIARGFLKSLLKSAKKIVSLILAFLFCSKIAILFDNWFNLIDLLNGPVGSLVEKIFGSNIVNTPFNEALSSDNALTLTLINLVKSVIGDASTGATTLKELISPIFSYYLSVVICFFIALIFFRLIFGLVIKLLSAIVNKIKILSFTDKILGFALGLFNAYIILSAGLAILSILPLGFLESVNLAISNSAVLSFVDNLNLLSLILEGLLKSSFLEGVLNKIIVA